MIEDILSDTIQKASAVTQDGDFQKDGLLHCGKCGKPKQCRVPFPFGIRIVGCVCQCRIDEENAEKAEMEALERQRKVKKLRNTTGQMDASMCFAAAEDCKAIRAGHAYVATWDKLPDHSNHLGLLLSGPSGSGKTFAISCIGNALLDKGVAVNMETFPRLTALPYESRSSAIEKMVKAPLLILDDFGAERTSGYALETIYLLVDGRYRQKAPLIVATDLSLKVLRAENVPSERKSIYSRLLEMCVPVELEAETDWRADKAAERLGEAARLWKPYL